MIEGSIHLFSGEKRVYSWYLYRDDALVSAGVVYGYLDAVEALAAASIA